MNWVPKWEKPEHGIDDPQLLELFRVRERIRWIEDFEDIAARKSPYHIFVIEEKGR